MALKDTLATLVAKAAAHNNPQRFNLREAALASVVAAGPALHGTVLVLTGNTIASNANTLTIPANTLKAGDCIYITGGFVTDGASTSVTMTVTAGGATVASSGADTNTAAHQWRTSVTLYYDGTNLRTLDSFISSNTTNVAASGASNAQAATATCAITLTASNAHATPSPFVVELIRP